MKSPSKLEWSRATDYAFVCLKNTLCRHTELTIPSLVDTFILSTNSSGDGIGAVLSVQRDRETLPITYYSKKLTQSESNYAIAELECLALVKSVEHFGHYLVGKPFRIIIDHKALEALQTSKRLTGRLTRWALLLQQYVFEVKYKPGTKHPNADRLSRQN